MPTVVGRLIVHGIRIGPYYLPSRKIAAQLLQPPDSDWAKKASEVLDTLEDHDVLDKWRAHSMRTWYFASALAVSSRQRESSTSTKS